MSADSNLARAAEPLFEPAELARWTGGAWEALPGLLHGVCRDSRGTTPGALYVALPGERFDGHDFVMRSLAAGAAAAMVRCDWQPPAGTPRQPLLRVDDTRRALAAAAAGYRSSLACFVVGVTGSVGKSTVKEWTAALLAACQPTAATRGNYNNDIGLPLSLLAMPRDTRAGVFEIGMNHPGELAPLCRLLRPDAAIVTAIGPVHIEFFGSVDAIAREKAELLRVLPADGFAVLDADSPHFAFLRRQTAARVISISLQAAPDADYDAAIVDELMGVFTLKERATGVIQSLQTGIPGRHHVFNATLAVAAARARAVPWETIARTLPRLPRLAMRWEEMRIGGVTLINDAYNANPLAMASALSTFAALAAGRRRVLVLGEMRELGAVAEAMHAEAGACVARTGGDLLVAVGTAGAWIAEAAKAHGFAGEIVLTSDATAAGDVMIARLHPGDWVLLKASRGVALEQAVTRLRNSQIANRNSQIEH
ncbi:MAG: UDP-N-acetylmuramoyl-tripeptide--D-alanyl-D-alanine ligase [Kiritimatiellae bacterium]|nr:UDP-N-acetylmuramoyl-tripeptide--D-alanyl-D-alanine ligase [Kiritimatiellia bacterium]